MPQVKISAHKKVGSIAFEHEGDLVVLADGASISASAWESAQKLDALAPHLAKGRVSAEPIPEPPTPKKAAPMPAPAPSAKSEPKTKPSKD